MIGLAQALAAPKVGRPQLMLASHEIDSLLQQQRDGEPAAVVSIGEHDIACGKSIEQLSQQRGLTGLFA
jgi:hypothetical protein